MSRFSVERIYLTLPKIRRGTFQGVTDFGFRKILCLRGLCHNISSNIFVSQCRKTLQGNPSVLCFRKFPVAKKFMDKNGGGGVSRFYIERIYLTLPKIRKRTFQGVTDFGYREFFYIRGLCHFFVEIFVSRCRKMP